MNALRKLLIDELADIYHAEKQLVKALPKMAKAAQHEELVSAFKEHLEQTQEQVKRVEQVFAALGEKAKAKPCKAMEGLVKEGEEIIDELEDSPAMDAGLISAAQKVEHYEIASYGCLCTWAEALGEDEALELLKETLNEEEQTDERLTQIAEATCNEEAQADEENEDTPEPKKRKSKKAMAS